MKRWGIRFSFGSLVIAALVACAGQPAEVQSTSAIVADVSPTLPPTDTPAPTYTPQPTITPEPTQTSEPTPLPEFGATNDANQWWDGAGWQGVPEGFQVSVGDDGVVKAVDAEGVEYIYENNVWIKASESYSHIQLAPDGSALQEYLNASGARVQPAIHLGAGAFELVPAGAVLPTHIYEANTGSWREVDRDKAIIEEVDTSTWFTATGSAGTIYKGLTMPMRVTTIDVPHLREIISYAPEVEEYFMVNWLRICHLAHTYQQRGNDATVDFETYVEMVKVGDPGSQIYVYRYELTPDGTRGALRQQLVDPSKGVTIQVVYDREFVNNPLATITNPNNAQSGIAFILGVTEVGQATVVVNVDADWFDAEIIQDIGDRLEYVALASPSEAMQWVGLYATGFAMQNSDANAPSMRNLIGKDLTQAVVAATQYSQQELGIAWEFWNQDLVEVVHD